MADARSNHEEFCIPVCVLPATISNNVPGTECSLGSDTGMNAIVEVRAPSPRFCLFCPERTAGHAEHAWSFSFP